MQKNYHQTWWEFNPRNQVVNEEKLLAVIAAFALEKRESSSRLVRMATRARPQLVGGFNLLL